MLLMGGFRFSPGQSRDNAGHPWRRRSDRSRFRRAHPIASVENEHVRSGFQPKTTWGHNSAYSECDFCAGRKTNGKRLILLLVMVMLLALRRTRRPRELVYGEPAADPNRKLSMVSPLRSSQDVSGNMPPAICRGIAKAGSSDEQRLHYFSNGGSIH